MPTVKSDAVLQFYIASGDRFHQEGFACPNWGDDPGTLNPRIFTFVSKLQLNLQAMLMRRIVDLDVPPDLNFLMDMHFLYKRCVQIVQAWTVPDNRPAFEPVHATPQGDVWLLWPVPYFKMQNSMIKSWVRDILGLVSELMQHSQNAMSGDINTDVATVIAQYMNRVYHDMAIQCFNKTYEQVESDEGFLLTQADFDAYDTAQLFPKPERTAIVTNIGNVFTEDMLRAIQGVPCTLLPPELQPRYGNMEDIYADARARANAELNASRLGPKPTAANEGGSADGTVSSSASGASFKTPVRTVPTI